MKINIIRAALFTPGPNRMWGLPMLLCGLPGNAKTAFIRQLAAEYDLPIEVLSPACRGEGAFGVTPVPASGRMTYPRPDWTDRFEERGRGIVFVDEINLAATHYAGALLGLLADRVLGSYQLPPGVRVCAAMNPISIAQASGGWDLSAPAANRVGHLDWPGPTAEEWTKWLLANDSPDDCPDIIDSEVEEARVMATWPEAWGQARGIVAGFLTRYSTHLHAMPTLGGDDVGKAWPSQRTWEMATRAWATSIVYNLTEAERDEFVGCFVGGGATGELLEWYSKANLPNSADLLDGLVKWQHNAKRLDVTTAVFNSATATCIETKDDLLRKKRSTVMWQLLAQATDTSPDLIVVQAHKLAKAGLAIQSNPATIKVLGKILPLLEAAGIVNEDSIMRAGAA
jgi:hypothetical protein